MTSPSKRIRTGVRWYHSKDSVSRIVYLVRSVTVVKYISDELKKLETCIIVWHKKQLKCYEKAI